MRLARSAGHPLVAARGICLLVVSLVALAACGSGGGAEPGGDQPGEGAGDGLATIAGALATVPASTEVDELVWSDLAQAAQVAGVERPDDSADGDAVFAYLEALQGRLADTGVYPLLPEAGVPVSGHLGMQAFSDELGWTLLDVDRFVERRTAPDSLAVFEGDFDQATITEALPAGDPTQARAVGDPRFQTLTGSRLSVSRTAGTAAATRDVAAGHGSTLADDPRLLALAEALDGQDPYSAMLAWPGPRLDQAQALTSCDGALPEPPAAVATGIADDGGPVVIVALVHATGDAASTNAAALPGIVENSLDLVGETVNDVHELESVDTTGEVVIVRLRPRDERGANDWWGSLVRRTHLVSHC